MTTSVRTTGPKLAYVFPSPGQDCMSWLCDETNWICLHTTACTRLLNVATPKLNKPKQFANLVRSGMEKEISFLLSKRWVLIPLIKDAASIMRHHNFVPTASWNTARRYTEGAMVSMKPSGLSLLRMRYLVQKYCLLWLLTPWLFDPLNALGSSVIYLLPHSFQFQLLQIILYIFQPTWPWPSNVSSTLWLTTKFYLTTLIWLILVTKTPTFSF
jgi:hypothetical protein